MLRDAKLVAFAATTDSARAAAFYGDVLGLPVRSDDEFAIVFDAVCGKLCASISMICGKTFGLCSLPDAMPRERVPVRWKMNGCVWQSALLS